MRVVAQEKSLKNSSWPRYAAKERNLIFGSAVMGIDYLLAGQKLLKAFSYIVSTFNFISVRQAGEDPPGRVRKNEEIDALLQVMRPRGHRGDEEAGGGRQKSQGRRPEKAQEGRQDLEERKPLTLAAFHYGSTLDWSKVEQVI